MNEVLNKKVEGRTFNEIQEDVQRIVYKFTGMWYNNYPTLRQHGYDIEQIIMDVYNGIYLKTKDDGLSNLERQFNLASDKEYSMKYIMNYIKVSVKNMLMCRARDISKKPILDSLDREVFDNSSSSVITLGEIVEDNKENFEAKVECQDLLDQIPNIEYPEYYYINQGKVKTLDTHQILYWITEEYTITSLLNIIKKYSNNQPISRTNMSNLKKEVILLAQDCLRPYLKEN